MLLIKAVTFNSRSMTTRESKMVLLESNLDIPGGNISISEDFKSLRIDLDNSRLVKRLRGRPLITIA